MREVETAREAERELTRRAFSAVLVALGGARPDGAYPRMSLARVEPRPRVIALLEGASRDEVRAALDAGVDDVVATEEDAELDARLAVLESRAAASAERASIGAVASGVAHHIRNPLNGAALHLEIARRAIATSDTAAMERALGSVKRDLDRIGRLATALLTCAEARAPSRRRADVLVAVRRAIDRTRQELGDPSIDLRVSAPPEPLLADFDPERIETAVASLLRNAAEAAGAGGQVSAGAHESDGQVWITVENTGCAPPAEVDVFAPFATTKAARLGLGLPGALRIAIDHGGRVHLARQGDRTMAALVFPVVH